MLLPNKETTVSQRLLVHVPAAVASRSDMTRQELMLTSVHLSLCLGGIHIHASMPTYCVQLSVAMCTVYTIEGPTEFAGIT